MFQLEVGKRDLPHILTIHKPRLHRSTPFSESDEAPAVKRAHLLRVYSLFLTLLSQYLKPTWEL